jgi:parallel beta-helix repeat protein
LDGTGYRITGNHIDAGINVSRVDNVTIRNASFLFCGSASSVYCYDSSSNKIIDNMFSSNVFAIEFEGNCQNSLIQNNSFHSNDIGIRILGGCYDTVVAENSFFDNGQAVRLEGDCDFSRIVNNNITGTYETGGIDRRGISVSGRLNTDLSTIIYSTDCGIFGNVIVNTELGVDTWGTSGFNLTNNIFRNSGLFVSSYSYGSTVYNNTINGKLLVYMENVSDRVVEEAGQVILVGCSNVTVENLNLSSSTVGVELRNTNNSRIANNTIIGSSLEGVSLYNSTNNTVTMNDIEKSSNVGVLLEYSYGNNITSNLISANNMGLLWYYSSQNLICHNSFLDNTYSPHGPYMTNSSARTNSWDNGYPSGGNFWGNDYNGTDWNKGSFQNVSGRDGIGDFAYIIDQDNQDNYPLMNPWHEPPWNPYASFNYSDTQPHINETVTFDAWGSYDFDGQILNYLWDFDDGTAMNETVSLTNHTFTFPRVYNVTLTVVDNDGVNGTAEKSISLIKIDSNLSISASPSAPALGQNTTLSGSVFPKRPQANVPIWVRSGNVWAILANVTTDEDSNYSYVWTPSGMGIYTIKANWTGDDYTFPSESAPLTVTCTRIPTSLSILTNCSSTLDAFKVEVKGTLLDIYSGRLKGETIVLSYTFAGIGIWTPITSDSTDDLGEFRIVWFPPATGNYMLKAEWSGNSTHFGVSSTIAVSTIPYENQYVFTVESNSTISDLIFDQNSGHLSFGVSGENGTTGYTRVTIAKSLIIDVTKIKILLDGLEYNYTVTELNDSWVLFFTYNHSVHQVQVDLQAAIPEFPSFLILALFMIGTVLAVAACKKNDSENLFSDKWRALVYRKKRGWKG